MAKLSAGVGVGQANRTHDVTTVQVLLKKNLLLVAQRTAIAVDGLAGSATIALIRRFQKNVRSARSPDGIVRPNGPTFRALIAHASSPPGAKPPTPPPEPVAKVPTSNLVPSTLTSEEYVAAAQALGCEMACIMAVVVTELGIRGPFDELGRPTILFERHKFSAFTKGKFDKSNPDISNPVAGGYGRFSQQYPKLESAIKLDKSAALSSASWGAFQIMGENHKAAGFASVDDFVGAMKVSVSNQLLAFVSFVKADARLSRALQNKNWAAFASAYNGQGYKANDYDNKMKNNYNAIVQRK